MAMADHNHPEIEMDCQFPYNQPVKVSELGEFHLIDRLARAAGAGFTSPDVVMGPGDDAAAWRTHDSVLLGTTDTLVQEVHFSEHASWRQIGWKALAVNLSDIAAMGGTPQYALVSLSLPGEAMVEDMVELALGFGELASRHNVYLLGGNISRAPIVVINIAVIGAAHPAGILTRKGARPGDKIAITGWLGSSAAGLRILSEGLSLASEQAAPLKKSHLEPEPRIKEGQVLASCGVQAGIDISDGLAADLEHVCAASGTGATVYVDRLPVRQEARAAFPSDYLDLALGGGEDYELLFTAREVVVEEAIKHLGRSGSCPVSIIGEVTPGPELKFIDDKGNPYRGSARGWDHFSKGG